MIESAWCVHGACMVRAWLVASAWQVHAHLGGAIHRADLSRSAVNRTGRLLIPSLPRVSHFTLSAHGLLERLRQHEA
jgi:hypothetical protein